MLPLFIYVYISTKTLCVLRESTSVYLRGKTQAPQVPALS